MATSQGQACLTLVTAHKIREGGVGGLIANQVGGSG